MARRGRQSARSRGQSLPQKATGKQPEGVNKEPSQGLRRSARLQRIAQQRGNRSTESGQWSRPKERQTPPSLPSPQLVLKPYNAPKSHHKSKEVPESGKISPQDQDQSPERPTTTDPSGTAQVRLNEVEGKRNNPLETWVLNGAWPSDYSVPDNWLPEDSEDTSLLRELMAPTPVVQYVEIDGMKYPRPIPKLPSSLRRKGSAADLSGSGVLKPRASKPWLYNTARYDTLLEAKGSYMEPSHLGITDSSRVWCKRLLDSAQTVPEGSLFRDDLFEKWHQKVRGRNEFRVVLDISRLIVPSAETLAIYGAKHLDILVENVNETWKLSIPVEGGQPCPDYSVGFRLSAFTDQQLAKLRPFIGTQDQTSVFVATHRMVFPFLTCEAKSGNASIAVADRQNAHSMTIAVRAVVELFRLVKREKELHQEILAFSVSHNDSYAMIYGHYALILEGKPTTFYRHPIRNFAFSDLRGNEKWTAHKFTKNVYDLWMPTHLQHIRSAIEQLPEVNFSISEGSEFQSPAKSRPSQGTDRHMSEPSNAGPWSHPSHGESSDRLPGIPPAAPPWSSMVPGRDQLDRKRAKRKHTEA